MTTDGATRLTDPAFIQRLESLALLARRVLGGRLQANRRTMRKGIGVTFADYAEYALGDDHRAIDWRVYGRTEELMIRLFEVEEDMTLIVLLDTSRSMAAKLDQAKRLAAAMAYIALSSFDQVVVYELGPRLRTRFEPSHGRGKLLQMLRTLDEAEATGEDSNFEECCRSIQARHRRRAMVLPISDFFFPGGFERGLSLLNYSRHEVYCIQVQDEADRRCTLRGDADLACVETGARKRVTITPAIAKAYENAVGDWNESLRLACARQGIGLSSITTEVPFDQVVQQILRRGGLVA